MFFVYLNLYTRRFFWVLTIISFTHNLFHERQFVAGISISKSQPKDHGVSYHVTAESFLGHNFCRIHVRWWMRTPGAMLPVNSMNWCMYYLLKMTNLQPVLVGCQTYGSQKSINHRRFTKSYRCWVYTDTTPIICNLLNSITSIHEELLPRELCDALNLRLEHVLKGAPRQGTEMLVCLICIDWKDDVCQDAWFFFEKTVCCWDCNS